MTCEISVIIRSMGRPWLAEAIASATNQSVNKLEILVVDAQGSHHPPLSDGHASTTIRLVSTGQPLSRAAAANVGIAAAQGDLLIFLDDDDLFLEGHLSGLKETLIAHPEAPASYAGISVIDAAGVVIDVYNAPYDPVELLGHNIFPIHAVLFRRASARDCRFDETLDVYEDWDFWLQLTRKGPLIHHNVVTAVYRVALGQSGLGIEANDALRQQGRARIYHKWRTVWTGVEWNAYIERNQKQLTDLERERAQLTAHLSQVEHVLQNAHAALDDTRQHFQRIEEARDQLEQTYIELNDEYDQLQKNHAVLIAERDRLQKERNQLEVDRDDYHRRWQAIEQSTFWRLTAPLRHTVIFIKSLRDLKNLLWRSIRWSFHRIPIAETIKRQSQDWLYQRFPSFFNHLPSYQFRMHGITHRMPQPGSALSSPYPIVSLEDLLPARDPPDSPTPPTLRVDVIIPIYDGIATTQRCLESVLGARTGIDHRLILINDASPRPEIRALLDAIPQSDQVLTLHNAQNLGFTATVNRGMALSTSHDVVLLNSDTEVPHGWLDRLAAQAYRAPAIGTVTPFSNNATICSYPNLPGQGTLPPSETLESIDQTMQSVNRGRQTDLPTAIGFCMYIKRDCLNQVGPFDEETFGRGYGEENDFCLRAARLGWRHILAADLFVFHAGEVSFGADSSPGKLRATAILRQRYPDYAAQVAAYVERDPARPWRLAVTAARWRQQSRPVVLMISHGLGGGVDKHLQDLSRMLTDANVRVLTLRSLPGRSDLAALESHDPIDGFAVCLPIDDESRLTEVIDAFGVSLTHIHHTMHWSIDLQALLARLGRPFLFTVHDYYTLCPRVNLMGPAHPVYCGEPDLTGCLDCLQQSPRAETTDIVHWRIRHAWLFQDASAVLCPSQDTLQRCLKYYPAARTQLLAVLHEPTPIISQPPTLHPIQSDQPLKVAILGVVARHKGLDLAFELARRVAQQRFAIQFTVIGYCAEAIPESLGRIITQTGPYEDQDLPRLILDAQPHLIWFPARWPETYSYTLSAALTTGIPILAPNLGAFVERLQNQPLAWRYAIDVSSTGLLQWLEQFRELRQRDAWPPPEAPTAVLDWPMQDASWYVSAYPALAERLCRIPPLDADERRWVLHPAPLVTHCTHDVQPFNLHERYPFSVVVIPEPLGLHPSPCGYIRLLLPLASALDHPAIRFASPAAALHYRASVFVTQRLAFPDLKTANAFQKTLRQQGSRLIYDLDDDLLDLDDGHDEAASYQRAKAVITAMLKAADKVWLSTEALADRVSPLNSRLRVAPNQLDRRLWRLLESEVLHHRPLRLLYMGTKTHRRDWMMVEPALKRIVQRHGRGVEIHIIGIDEPGLLPPWTIVHEPPPGISAVYPAFVHWLQSLGPFNIGIAPLASNPFNLAKSGIKFMDYTALGAVTAASDLPPYQAVIRHEDNGILVADSAEDWEQALESLIAHPERRQALWRQAQQDWLFRHSYHSATGSDLCAHLIQFADRGAPEEPLQVVAMV
jgi:GT2 family glycosyltransferase/glycosyltransferase involved in cell wall biosynthesis